MPEPTTASDATGAVPQPQPAPRRSPLRQTVRDVTLSMGVVAAIIAGVMIVTWRPQPDPVREVDALPVARAVAAAVDFPLLFPDVDSGWRATSARFEPTEESQRRPVWFNGWVTPDDQYAVVIQSTANSDDFVAEQTLDGRPPRDDGPTTPLPGWTPYVSADGEQRSLVRRADGVTTIVASTAGWPELIAFRDSLRAVPGR